MKWRGFIDFIVFIIICLAIGAWMLFLATPAASKYEVDQIADNYISPDPCGLWDVVCEGEVLREITAFTSRPEETDNTPFITADGTDLRITIDRVCAANFVPFGTVLTIDHVGNCVVHDRLASRFPERVDVYMTDLQTAKQFGLQYQYVSVR
jgi:3D (Asp-Asp-Asp) domain-containing protein